MAAGEGNFEKQLSKSKKRYHEANDKTSFGDLWLVGEKWEGFVLKSPPGEKLLPVVEGSSNLARLSNPPLEKHMMRG